MINPIIKSNTDGKLAAIEQAQYDFELDYLSRETHFFQDV